MDITDEVSETMRTIIWENNMKKLYFITNIVYVRTDQKCKCKYQAQMSVQVYYYRNKKHRSVKNLPRYHFPSLYQGLIIINEPCPKLIIPLDRMWKYEASDEIYFVDARGKIFRDIVKLNKNIEVKKNKFSETRECICGSRISIHERYCVNGINLCSDCALTTDGFPQEIYFRTGTLRILDDIIIFSGERKVSHHMEAYQVVLFPYGKKCNEKIATIKSGRETRICVYNYVKLPF